MKYNIDIYYQYIISFIMASNSLLGFLWGYFQDFTIKTAFNGLLSGFLIGLAICYLIIMIKIFLHSNKYEE